MEDHGVVVVGGGPVGLTTALLLSRHGIPVTVFERERAVPEDYRASTFHAPTLDLLEECGITAFLLSAGIECPRFQYRGWKEGKIAEFDHALLAADTRHPYRLQCEQYKLSRHLHERLAGTPGVKLRFGWGGHGHRAGRGWGRDLRPVPGRGNGSAHPLRHWSGRRAEHDSQGARNRLPRIHLSRTHPGDRDHSRPQDRLFRHRQRQLRLGPGEQRPHSAHTGPVAYEPAPWGGRSGRRRPSAIPKSKAECGK